MEPDGPEYPILPTTAMSAEDEYLDYEPDPLDRLSDPDFRNMAEALADRPPRATLRDVAMQHGFDYLALRKAYRELKVIFEDLRPST